MYRGGPHRRGVIYDPALSINQTLITLPEEFSVSDNFPNPFNPSTTVRITLPSKLFLTAEVYDLTGKRVRDLVSKELPKGAHFFNWDGIGSNDVPVSTGIYFLSVRAGNRHHIQKMTLLK